MVVLFSAACSATPSWIPVETAGSPVAAVVETAPTELAFVDQLDDAVVASHDFCTASANVWIHSAALNLIGSNANPEMTQIALANVAEWLERSTLLDEVDGTERAQTFAAFTELQATVGTSYGDDWAAFQASTAYANDPSAQEYEAGRSALVPFINDQCEFLSMADLSTEAEARANELRTEFATDPSTVVDSDSLPGHAIFTHSSGRLIASFPGAWSYEEGRSDALVDLVASPDIERFLDNEALDGVRLQLFNAPTSEAFRYLIDETMTASSCDRTNDLVDSGTTRLNITQTYACADHGASIIGQYNESRGLGLIIEAAFDRPDASRADLIRLASIANSALWS